MPEVAEVAITAQILNQKLIGHKLKHFHFTSKYHGRATDRSYNKFMQALPLRVKKVDSKGKFMWFELHSRSKDDIWYIWNTYGLTGMWGFNMNADYIRAKLEFDGGINAYYSDLRKFGTFRFDQDKEALDKKIKSLTPDLLKDNFDASRAKKYRVPIVKIIMDQHKIGSGIGNYLAAEILYRAKINPHRRGSDLTTSELTRLEYWIKYVVKLAYIDNHTGYMINIEHEADKIKRKNYHPEIKLRNKTFEFLVYRRKKDPHGNIVKADKINNNRTTYWVPRVQR